MALSCNSFTSNTLATTECQVANMVPCPELYTGQFIDPPQFYYMALDALVRKLGKAPTAIAAGDLYAVVQNARCAENDNKAFPDWNEQKMQALILYYLNEILCAG